MNKSKIFCNERGYMLLNVVLLTLITSFAATILFNAAPRMRNPQSVLRLTAIHLANEKFALIESTAAAGSLNLNCAIEPEHLKTENLGKGKPITFTVTATEENADGNLHFVKVKVEWTVDGENFKLELERTIRVVQ